MDRGKLSDKDESRLPGLYAVLPASLACGDDSACNAQPARTARRIVIFCVSAAVVLMAAMLMMNLR